MTNDYKLELMAAQIANDCHYEYRHGHSIGDAADKVLLHLQKAVTAALEEAAKVASNRVMYWIEQPIFTDTDNRFNSAREAEARAIELAIRALKPVQP